MGIHRLRAGYALSLGLVVSIAAGCSRDFTFLDASRVGVTDVVDSTLDDVGDDAIDAVDATVADVPEDLATLDVRDVPAVDAGPDVLQAMCMGSPPPLAAHDVIAGAATTCAFDGTGALRCWGWNDLGQLGDGTNTTTAATAHPTIVSMPLTRLDLGYAHACAVTDIGNLWCWGNNCAGQLGVATTGTACSTPSAFTNDTCGTATPACARSPVQVPIASVIDVALGQRHSCALATDRTVSCWGFGANGQLGTGTPTSSMTPMPVRDRSGATLTGVTQISAGTGNTTCAVRCDQTLWCWGVNDVGQAGLDPASVSQLPQARQIPVPEPAVRVAESASNGCAVTSMGHVYCWGLRQFGAIGSGSITGPASAPTQVDGISNAIDVAVGYFHACALIGTGEVYCWGTNDVGQLGDGSGNTLVLTPARAAITGVTGITAGPQHTCAINASHAVFCWGRQLFNRIGDSLTSDGQLSVPTRVTN